MRKHKVGEQWASLSTLKPTLFNGGNSKGIVEKNTINMATLMVNIVKENLGTNQCFVSGCIE